MICRSAGLIVVETAPSGQASAVDRESVRVRTGDVAQVTALPSPPRRLRRCVGGGRCTDSSPGAEPAVGNGDRTDSSSLAEVAIMPPPIAGDPWAPDRADAGSDQRQRFRRSRSPAYSPGPPAAYADCCVGASRASRFAHAEHPAVGQRPERPAPMRDPVLLLGCHLGKRPTVEPVGSEDRVVAEASVADGRRE